MNRGFNVKQFVGRQAERTNFHTPATTRNRVPPGLNTTGIQKIRVGAQVDPFGKINAKARKLIESVERAERRTGSTGGSSEMQVDLDSQQNI